MPLVMALFSLTTPAMNAWSDFNHLLPCKRFCFKERAPQAAWLDAYRRRFITAPVDEYAAPGALTPAPREMRSEGGARIMREGRDAAGAVMWIRDTLQPADGVIVRGRSGQTFRPYLGYGRYLLRIAYRSSGVAEANASTRFYLMPTPRTSRTILRAPLPPSRNEYATFLTAPPGLAGNLFGWDVQYSGKGVFELHEVSLRKIEE
ncbi:MAG: hypothetical protein OD918_03215 [Gammaproteobacteria bacterium]